MTARGLQFDDRLWVCGYCKTVCMDYPTLKEHRVMRCRKHPDKVRMRTSKVPSRKTYAKVLAKGQKVLEEWGVR